MTGTACARALALAVALALAFLAWAQPAAAQVPTRPALPQQYPPTQNQRRTTRDSIIADSLRKLYASDSVKHAVHWVEPDSMAQALLDREGYSITRYQGREAKLNADTHDLQVEGEKHVNVGRAAVQRDTTLIIGNTLHYNDSTQQVDAKGDTIVLHDPTQNESDVFSFGHLTYNVANHTAVVTTVSTEYTQSGQRWFIAAKKAAYVGDTTKGKEGGHSVFYGRDADITTCDDSFPHYHIKGGEMKYVSKRVLVIRPAVLYIADVPILWLPFMFQDLRRGRRSGILTPHFGFTELIRNNPDYRRHLENLGYYFDLGEYADATAWLDWRSGARPTVGDPGYVQYNGEFRYRWLNRFLNGDLAMNYRSQQDGSTNTSIYWNHRQDFSLHSHLQLNINYVTSTIVQQQAYLNPYAALANINSQLNFQQDLGPTSISIGGTQTQYPGQTRLDRTFPTVSLSSKPVQLGNVFTWSPSLSLTNAQSFNINQTGDFQSFYLITPQGNLDSTTLNRDTRNTTASFDTPIKFFGFNLRNSFNVRDQFNNFPQTDIIYTPARINGRDTTVQSTRVFRTTYATALDWDTGLDLPPIGQGKWNIIPSVSIVNADAQAPFLQRTELSGADFVTQSKRLVYGVSASPTFFGLFPGFLGISRFRHSITPTVSFNYSPEAHVDDTFLLANGQNPSGYLGNLEQESMTIGLSTNIEAKFRDGPDTAPDNGTKIKLLSLNFDPVTYDFARARATHSTGLTTNSFGYDLRTEMIPGFDFRETYSLFQGNPESDTAVFKPFLTSVSASFSFGANSRLLDPFKKLLGIPVKPAKPDSMAGRDPFFAQQAAAAHVAGQGAQYAQYAIPQAGQGWNVSVTYTENRQRPPVGNLQNAITFDPLSQCTQFQTTNPSLYAICVNTHRYQSFAADSLGGINATTQGAPFLIVPPQQSVSGSLSFNITPRWSAQWQTTYDFTGHNFASQVVTLQRDLHDWRAVFSFTQSPTGSFGFTFFVALKAEPALKFNYDRSSYRAPTGSSGTQF